MAKRVKMQRALEICVEYEGRGGFAYREAWVRDGSPERIAVMSGEFYWTSENDWVGPYIPSAEDVIAHDWKYEY